MNFQTIPPVDQHKDLLDLAFRRARSKSKNIKKIYDPIIKAKKKGSIKLDVVKDSLYGKLGKILSSLPETKKLPPFYEDLMKLTLDYPLYKKSCGAIDWTIKKVNSLHRQYVSKINKASNVVIISKLSKEFYGRISSVLKQINSNLQYLNKARRTLRTYPDIKEMFTVCIYGFPNVGKTTLLNKLTKTKAKVAAYAFTTISINAGYFTVKEEKVQVLDVPGTLSRKEKMNNVELQAELVVEKLADIIIYVFDLSGYCGYPVEKQVQLFSKISKKTNVLVYLSKKDLLDDSIINNFNAKHLSQKELKEEIVKLIPEDE